MRYAAVAALLRLFRAHETRLSRRYFQLLSEGYCDYFPEPRTLLLGKIRRALVEATVRGPWLRGGVVRNQVRDACAVIL